jgi:hypothetical protein
MPVFSNTVDAQEKNPVVTSNIKRNVLETEHINFCNVICLESPRLGIL